MTPKPKTPIARPGAHPASGRAPALLLRGIDKSFDGHRALQGASFRLGWGEVHALVGENGAGKSTIMNVATAVYAADAGEVIVDGRDVPLRGPADAMAAGLGMVHQHFRLVGSFTVAENVALALRGAGNNVTLPEAARLLSDRADELGFRLDAGARIDELSIAERQRAEILKVLLLGAGILILDEPTAVLTAEEARALLTLVRALAREGHAVVLITHKLREVAAYSDRITVMRQGRTVLDAAPSEGLDMGEVARLAVGEMPPTPPRVTARPGAPLLRIAGLSARRADGSPALDGLALDLAEGEVLGIAGVGGNGQSELVDLLSGLRRPDAGTIRLGPHDLVGASPARRRAEGLRVIPADRFDSAMAPGLTLAENLALTGVSSGRFGSRWLLDRARMRREAERLIAANEGRGGGPGTKAALLSGGNAQKLLLAREVSSDARLLVAHSPSRGLDLRATQAVHQAIADGVARGMACLLISEDLEEIMSLSSRVCAINNGRLSAPMPVAEVTPERLGALLVGHA
ncbi:ABC transporter ATP-binding protein [Pseudooceanicola sp. HF7]|uniref:ABC transporter ATP-binding protein n=1 Tax=Pseudooceanicola sp. HF7 TaxID=2721560 RepID=UPI0014312DDF|nr:ATP-binding cassette domain-containing protein [Pseudooceanicola sp. HF7]NIZ07812.1 ATP-binding cassette domain-containing protein [Pseudooceanicola sp. HF7]